MLHALHGCIDRQPLASVYAVVRSLYYMYIVATAVVAVSSDSTAVGSAMTRTRCGVVASHRKLIAGR